MRKLIVAACLLAGPLCAFAFAEPDIVVCPGAGEKCQGEVQMGKEKPFDVDSVKGKDRGIVEMKM